MVITALEGLIALGIAVPMIALGAAIIVAVRRRLAVGAETREGVDRGQVLALVGLLAGSSLLFMAGGVALLVVALWLNGGVAV